MTHCPRLLGSYLVPALCLALCICKVIGFANVNAMLDVGRPIGDVLECWDGAAKASFLERYWGKQPCLIRGMFFGSNPTSRHPKIPSKDELLELSMDDDVESRILVKKGGERGDRYSKDYGPFDKQYLRKFFRYNDSDLTTTTTWTVLVQEADRHIPAVADLWEEFDFIPAWRRDDIMISFASRGGGIGAHVDNYDVFLLQGRGTREWSIENTFLTLEKEQQREVPNIDTRLLRDFCSDQSWILHPGDVLYLPPRIPHRGTALGGDCTTVSMGFRAPAYRSLLSALTAHICETRLSEGLLYRDPDLGEQQHKVLSSATVSSDAQERIRTNLRNQVLSVLDGDADEFQRFLGTYLTEPLRMHVRVPTPFFLRQPAAATISTAATTTNTNASDQGQGQGQDQDQGDGENQELPLSITSTVHAVASRHLFDSAESVIAAVLDGRFVLRRAEGVRAVHIGDALYFNGHEFPLPAANTGPTAGLALVELLAGGHRIVTSKQLEQALGPVNEKVHSTNLQYVNSLIVAGYFYPVERAATT